MLIDLHVHEELFSPCSWMSLEDAVAAAQAKGLDGLCITNHNSLDIQEQAAQISLASGFPVFVGVEVSTLQGDIVAFGLPALSINTRVDAQEFIDLVNSHNGFCFSAHPFRTGGGGLGSHVSAVKGLHGIEVYNGGNVYPADNLKALQECQRLDLVPVAGSDAHGPGDVGLFATWFPGSISTMEELVAALKSGNCQPVALDTDGVYR